MMVLSKTKTAAVLLFVPCSALAKTLRDCVNCLNTVPGTFQCLFDTDQCELSKCFGFGLDGGLDFDGCGCADCIQPILQCLDDCTPPCLDDHVWPFITCMGNTSSCFWPCLRRLPRIAGLADDLGLPYQSYPNPCTLDKLKENPVGCLLPVFKECNAAQEDVMDTACEMTDCCPSCQDELMAIGECFFNWMSGRNCDFSCSASRRFLNDVVDPIMSQNRSNSIPVLTANDRNVTLTNEIVEECRKVVALELLEHPDRTLTVYLECIVNHAVRLTVDPANDPSKDEIASTSAMEAVTATNANAESAAADHTTTTTTTLAMVVASTMLWLVGGTKV